MNLSDVVEIPPVIFTQVIPNFQFFPFFAFFGRKDGFNMRIAICDDSPFDRNLIVDLLLHYFADKPIHYELTSYESGIHLLCDIEEGRWFDMVFLDIYLNELLGIDVAYKLRDLQYSGAIVFLTASSDFAVDSYDVAAAGYLLKPHSFEKLCMCMDRIIQSFDTNVYQIRQRARVIRVPYNEIVFVESSNSKCILHRRDGASYVIYKRLDEIERELNDNCFLRCHQSYLVNMDHIQQVDRQFELSTGDIALIRQRDLKAIRQTYLDYVAARADKTAN